MRIGIVGAGFMAETHARAWAATPARVAAVYAPRVEPTRQLAAQVEAHPCGTLAELIAMVDVVDICAPTDQHCEIALQAAAAGRHLLVEKPLARSLGEGEAMLRACQQAGVQLLVGHVLRFFPEYAAAQASVARGDIGQVAVLRLTRGSFQPWAGSFALAAGRRALRRPHPRPDDSRLRLRALAGRRSRERPCPQRAQPRRRGSRRLLPGDSAASRRRHQPHRGRLGLPAAALPHGAGNRRQRRPHRTAGRFGHPAQSAADAARPGRSRHRRARQPAGRRPFVAQLRHVYSVLAENATPRCSGADALAALRIALAARVSARSGRPVRPDELDAEGFPPQAGER